MNAFYNPVRVMFGSGSIGELGAVVQAADYAADRILLLTRGGDFEKGEHFTAIMDQLRGREVLVRSVDVSNPDVTDLFQIRQQTDGFPYDLIVAVGGGSVLDVAKSAAALRGLIISSEQELRDTITSGSYLANQSVCPWIALPTTAGTGSEVTPWATIWDKERDLKYSVESKRCFAQAAIVDPDLTVSLPVRTSVVTGLDALCHAAEAYWSNRTNDISRLYAVQAIECMVGNLGKVVDDPRNGQIRSQLAKGSMLAGLAFSNTRTTACHSISYPLTLLHGIEHGVAVSMTLPKMMKLNEHAIVEKERLFAAFGAADAGGVERVIAAIYDKAGLGRYLRQYGVKEDGLAAIVDKSFTKGRMDNNPVKLERSQVLELLTGIYSAS